ncbi:MAG: hypothetical protein AB7V62_13215 [Thermoleophilia bacterium]
MRRVLVSLHHSHGHSGVVIGDEGVLLVRDLRAAAAGWTVLQGDRPGLLEWPGGHVVVGGLLPGGAAAAAALVNGRRAAAVVAGGAWIVAATGDGARVPVVYSSADGEETGRAVAGA